MSEAALAVARRHMAEQHQFYLGEHDCDVPFGNGAMRRVGISLVTDSIRSRRGMPVLRLFMGHRMDFLPHEQTPAGHAAWMVADWLNTHADDETIRHVAERFLGQWPGIHRDGKGKWRLTGLEERGALFSGMMVDCEGTMITDEAGQSDLPAASIIQSPNLQVWPYGYCRKKGPCFLQDACFSCPFFMTGAAFLPALRECVPGLQITLKDALLAHHHHLAEARRLALHGIQRISEALQKPDVED